MGYSHKRWLLSSSTVTADIYCPQSVSAGENSLLSGVRVILVKLPVSKLYMIISLAPSSALEENTSWSLLIKLGWLSYPGELVIFRALPGMIWKLPNDFLVSRLIRS